MKKIMIIVLIFSSLTLGGCLKEGVSPEIEKISQNDIRSNNTITGNISENLTKSNSGISGIEDEKILYKITSAFISDTIDPINKDEIYNIEIADKTSLKKISNTIYLKDKNNTYSNIRQLSLIDLDPKKIKGILPYKGFTGTSFFTTDGDTLYFAGKEVENGDINTLKFSDSAAGDKNNLYLGFQVFTGGDIETLQDVDPESGWPKKDKNNVYYAVGDLIRTVDGADVNTYMLLNFHFSKDKNHIYYMWDNLQGADIQTFETLGRIGFYAKDKNHVYYGNKIVQGLNPKDAVLVIKPVESGYAESYIRDDKNLYKDGELQEGIKPNSIEY